VGDRNPSLPTVNGFDEFFGNLYHLMPRKSPSSPTTRKTRYGASLVRAAYSSARRPTMTTRRSTPASGRSESKRLRHRPAY
jgi:hypothetical protein